MGKWLYTFNNRPSHFKGHELTGFGGAIKNIGMGCLRECANNGLKINETTRKMSIDENNCVGCGRCLGACNFDAIYFNDDAAAKRTELPYGRIHISSY